MRDDAAWHLITGEYPPRAGGVADYTHLLAGALAGAGREVHVWTGPAEGDTPAIDGVAVHRDAGDWGATGLARLDAALDALPGPRRLLVQYTTNAWGHRGMNLGFGRWLVRRRGRGDEIWAMIHEAFYMYKLVDKPTRYVLATAHRLMMRSLLAASSRAFLSMPVLEGRVRPYAPRGEAIPMGWLPVPSNVPVIEDDAAVDALRRRWAPRGEAIVGAFSTFGHDARKLLRAVLPSLLSGYPNRVGLLIGRNGHEFAAALMAEHPALEGRLAAPGGLPPEQVSLHLQACDLLVQPYEDGVSSRRGTVMAGLAHGRPIATNLGFNSEPLWAESGAVAAAKSPADLPRIAAATLDDRNARAQLGAAARALYERRFALDRTLEALLASAGTHAGRPAAIGVSGD